MAKAKSSSKTKKTVKTTPKGLTKAQKTLVEKATNETEFTVVTDDKNVYIIGPSIPDTVIPKCGVIDQLKESEKGEVGEHKMFPIKELTKRLKALL